MKILTIIRRLTMACLAAVLSSCSSSDFGQEKLFGSPEPPLLMGESAGPAAPVLRPPVVAAQPSPAATLAAR